MSIIHLQFTENDVIF